VIPLKKHKKRGTPSGYGQNIDEEWKMSLIIKSWWDYKRVLMPTGNATWAPNGNMGAN
jgi:hypothetical protein